MTWDIDKYKRPKDIKDETKKRIEQMFGNRVFIFWDREEIMFGSTPIPMEKLGKLIGLIGQECATVRKNKKDSTL